MSTVAVFLRQSGLDMQRHVIIRSFPRKVVAFVFTFSMSHGWGTRSHSHAFAFFWLSLQSLTFGLGTFPALAKLLLSLQSLTSMDEALKDAGLGDKEMLIVDVQR